LFVGACFNHQHHPILAEDLGFFFSPNFVTEHELQSSIAQLSEISTIYIIFYFIKKNFF
jgi:hypothetical protein